MKIYSVHYRQEAGASLTGLADEVVLVREGFSWPAFFVPFFWLIYKRMWIVLAVYLAIEIALTSLAAIFGLPDGVMFVCSLTLSLIVGFEGNNLHRWTLERNRFRQQAIVAGADLAEAEHRFFISAERQLDAGRPAGASS
ncbi:MAG: DUF2628 domain-containing protein [Aestuariivirgaceae bacterium]